MLCPFGTSITECKKAFCLFIANQPDYHSFIDIPSVCPTRPSAFRCNAIQHLQPNTVRQTRKHQTFMATQGATLAQNAIALLRKLDKLSKRAILNLMTFWKDTCCTLLRTTNIGLALSFFAAFMVYATCKVTPVYDTMCPMQCNTVSISIID